MAATAGYLGIADNMSNWNLEFKSENKNLDEKGKKLDKTRQSINNKVDFPFQNVLNVKK